MNWNNVKKSIQEKKDDYFISRSKSTSELEPPYSEEEISQSENVIDERFPEDFREYLLYVSREVICGQHPMVFKLPMQDIGICKLPASIIEFDKEMYDDEIFNGIAYIGTSGYCNYLYIVLKGTRKGTIWSSDTSVDYELEYGSFSDSF